MQRRDLLDGRLEAGLGAGRDLDDLAAERAQHVAVAGVAGPRHRHPVAGLERREEGEQEAAAGAGRHDDLLGGRPSTPCVRWWCAGDRLAQLEDAGGGRVAERVARLEQPHRLVAHRHRRAGARLAGEQVEHVAVGALARAPRRPAGP